MLFSKQVGRRVIEDNFLLLKGSSYRIEDVSQSRPLNWTQEKPLKSAFT